MRKRCELTLWFSEEAIQAWQEPPSLKPGGQRIYSDLAIETALTVHLVYRLGLRQTEGFLRSIATLLGLAIPIPDHSTLSRRSQQLNTVCSWTSAEDEPVHILIDSTGLKVHRGNGVNGQTGHRRVWRKLHVTVNARSGEFLACEVTTHRSTDASQVPNLVSAVDSEIASMTADGAYDARSVYEAIDHHPSDHPTTAIIPPRCNARSSRKALVTIEQRNHTIRWIRGIGRRRWQKASGYTRRSGVEAAIYRYKSIIGPSLRGRTMASQRTEARIACAILNKMTNLGMPESYCAA